MKMITIRELRNRTGDLVRAVSRHGEIRVTDGVRLVARILPQTEARKIPYFASRRPSAAFRRLDESGKTGRSTDSTITISRDRESQRP
jgi:prevent-host-death family protein